MGIEWWQILLLTLYAGYQICDELTINSSAGSAVFAGFISGIIMGDMKTGLMIGGAMQLTVLGVGTFGGSSRIDANSGTVLATAFSVGLGMNQSQAISAIAVPVAALLIQTDILARFANTFFAHRIDRFIETENYKAIERNYLYGAIPWALSRALPVFLALTFGGGLVNTVVSYMNSQLSWLATGLETAGAVLPAVGFAILLRYLPVKKHFPYLIIGFIVTALFATIYGDVSAVGTAVTGLSKGFAHNFAGLPMLGIALIGFGFAAIEYKHSMEKHEVVAGQGSAEQQETVIDAKGEIEDDEL
ncbi:PTS mannose/fructose/sorbose/N-acetylgalactosamine transporter subunit IIC [Latilactobacillus fuchuensis]|uniref:PTS mannose/fructose/sorbose/N-acetylgalactosamine transporter subunit IIC n=1 Tax=Latilactobacillus fuchuensis TaxID=164393 RepID=UPI0039B08452